MSAPFADGTWTEVLEAQRRATLEEIVVSQGVPMGPRGLAGPTGPMGAKGESTEWTLGEGAPPDPTLDNEYGDIYLDTVTGSLYVLRQIGTIPMWIYEGNYMGATGPAGATGPSPNLAVGEVTPGDGPSDVAVIIDGTSPDYTLSFVVPSGETGPVGRPPILFIGDVTGLPPGADPDVFFSTSVEEQGLYVLDWAIPAGPTGPAGTNIKILGELGGVEDLPMPPLYTGWPSGYQNSYGDGWVIPTLQPSAGEVRIAAVQPSDTGLELWVDTTESGIPGGGEAGGRVDPLDISGYDKYLKSVWVWTEHSDWIDVGPVVGPPGPEGPAGPGLRHREVSLRLTVNPSTGDAEMSIMHSFPDPYPLVRVMLMEIDLVTGEECWIDSQSVQVTYKSETNLVISMDQSMIGIEGKVVIM